MARVSDGVLPDGAVIGMSLDRYSDIIGSQMGHNLCAFNGINRPSEDHPLSCMSILSQSDRDEIAKYIYQAEEMREEELGYFLTPKWTTEELGVGAGNPFELQHKFLIEVGTPTWSAISLGEAVTFGVPPFSPANEPTDPVQIVVTVATTVPLGEIVVTYPDELVKIKPSSVTRLGTDVTISIPRCRLVKPEYNDDWQDPPSYYDDDVFLDTVDVYRLYSDVSTGAQFVWYAASCDTDCEPNCQPACPMIVGTMAHELSLVTIKPATYSNSAWTTGCMRYSYKPDAARFTYLSGKTASMTNELFTIRLAYTLMNRPPCSCEVIDHLWQEDRVKMERMYTPYGFMAGSGAAWLHDQRQKVISAGVFPGVY